MGLRNQKRGIALLIVLSLLALFTLLVVTFVISAGQYRTAAMSQERNRRFEDDPRKILDLAMMPLLRDSKTRSPLQYHSMLYDFYGTDGISGRVTSATRPTGANSTQEQCLQIDFDYDTLNQPFGRTLSDINDYYGGAVITFLEGSAKGKSTRILKYTYAPTGTANTGRLLIDASAEGREQLGSQVLNSAPLIGQIWPVVSYQVPYPRFVINGAPFNGTGHGYRGSPFYDSNAMEPWYAQNPSYGSNMRVALLPNFSAYPQVTNPTAFNAAGLTAVQPNLGGPDEGWDAPDFHTMFLAMVPADVVSNTSRYIIPSFHRPELIHYWMKQSPGPWGAENQAPANQVEADFRRMVIQRPMPWDHPNFTGSNKYLASSNLDMFLHIRGLKRNPSDPNPAGSLPSTAPGQEPLVANYWDVDNDGDGVPDSVWMDIGLPARTSADGRIFKPLVAFLVKDLDGRLNLNACSSIESHEKRADQVWINHPGPDGRWGKAGIDDNGDGTFDDPGEAGWGPQTPMNPADDSDDVKIAMVKPSSVTPEVRHYLARGLGIGPAEISLKPALDDTTTVNNANEFERVLLARNLDRDTSLSANLRVMPGKGGTNDELSAIKRHDWTSDYQVGAVRGGFGAHPDSRGVSGIGLDAAGQPVVAHGGNLDDDKDDPYEVRLDAETLTRNARDDQLFTIADMERILRFNDLDSLEGDQRLLDLTVSMNNTSQNKSRINRNLVTVHSSYVPAPRFAVTKEGMSSSGMPTSARLLDLYKAKLLAKGVTAANIQTELDKIVPFELRRGQLFDINRPFGNYRDDNANNVVDEPMEVSGTEYAWTDPAIPAGSRFKNVNFSHRNNDPLITTWQQGTRQIYARHLYCLMMLLVSQTYDHPTVETLPAGVSATQLTAKRIAQWAVNVVDFRDPDAIMTGFEVDLDPFDGWQVDGYINTAVDGGTQRYVVWGCESPDLQISETLAFHNRCIKDTNWDDGRDTVHANGGPEQTYAYDLDTMTYDREPDQFRIPEGSLFVELKSARSPFFITPPTPVMPAPPVPVLPPQTYNPLFAPELYNIDNTTKTNPIITLDLGRMSGPNSLGTRYPVWRLAVANSSPSVIGAAYGSMATTPVETKQTESGGAATARSEGSFSVLESAIERVIWFSPYQPGATDPWKNMAFYGRTGSMNGAASATSQNTSTLNMAVGGYAVIGPRLTTYVGLSSADVDMNPLTYDNSSQSLDLNGGTFTSNGTSCSVPATGILPTLGVVCAADPPTTWGSAAGQPRPDSGMNVSEPLPQSGNYYRQPVAGANIPNGYYNATMPIITDPMLPAYNALPDVPFDGQTGTPLASLPNGVNTGTTINHRSIYLQRLADPTLPWNPSPDDPVAGASFDNAYPVNPYITVDWSTVDLTVFSGDEDTNQDDIDPGMTGMPTWIDPDDQDPYQADTMPGGANDVPESYDNSTALEQFSGRARGIRYTDSSSKVRVNPWTPQTRHPRLAAAAVANAYFPYQLVHTFGFLNDSVEPTPVNKSYYVAIPGQAGGNDVRPPWLTWSNRPFANPFELMLVPSSSPARMFYEFVTPTMVDSNGATAETDYIPFLSDPSQCSYDKAGGVNSFRAPYSALLNFFHSSAGTDAGHFGRLLDFVETPSPFVGTETWFDPQYFANATQADYFRPPFNRLSRFHDPGRININTVFDKQVWEGITKNFPAWDPSLYATGSTTSWDTLQESRRGFSSYDVAKAELSSSFPTRFANPFRGAVGSHLMPNVGGMSGHTDIQSTLLRADDPGSPTDPLLRFTSPPFTTPTATLTENYLASMKDPDGSAFFRYQGMMRLSNLLSTNSNVFAVWVTVGFFELESIASGPTTAFPDGYLLGQELGSDVGTVKRHRGFYIIDRTVPVGFEPGENHNVEQTILLRRCIE